MQKRVPGRAVTGRHRFNGLRSRHKKLYPVPAPDERFGGAGDTGHENRSGHGRMLSAKSMPAHSICPYAAPVPTVRRIRKSAKRPSVKRWKGENDMVIIIPIVLVIVLLIWGVATYNRLVTERLKVRTQWSQIDVVLRQRSELIPNLMETVKGYAAHEKEALQAVTDARSRYLAAADAQGQMNAGTELSGAMSRLMAVAESYPELKANQNFLHLQQQLSDMEEKLTNYRQFYNDTVLRYDRLLETVPSSLIARLFHFQKEEFLTTEESEKARVTVRF